MKACSFLPAATEIIARLGLNEHLCGVTFECPSDKPKVVRSHLEGNHYSSDEIDRIVSQSKAQGKSLYYIDEPLLERLSPDVIFTQDVCDVCQIDTSYVARAVYKLPHPPQLVPLIPKTLADVYGNVLAIATEIGHEEVAYPLLASLTARTDAITNHLRAARAPVRRVCLIEWMSPLYNCGHWIPDQLAAAGGVDMLSNPGGYSIRIEWEKLRLYNPEVLVIAPCGLSIPRAQSEVAVLEALPGWSELKAVESGEVYFANSDLFTCPSTRLVDGIETLAALFHPALFPDLLSKHASHFAHIEHSKLSL